MKRLCLILLLSSGCARFSTVQTDVSGIDVDGYETRTITTKAKATTFWASRSALANWKASQTDKTQGASVGTLTQESNMQTNVASLVEAIVAGAVRGAVK